ncbi:MAG: hypothetical protein NTY02_03810 [Acidobacteria bacterium]|nr:hypothetical protein [Acidobacteriota bacterium]
MNANAIEMLIPMVVSVGFFSLIGWIVFVFVDGRRRREQLKALTEFHGKFLEKMSSTTEFGAFLETDGGKQFLKVLSVEGPGAKTRIVQGTERGILCLTIGLALLLLGWAFHDLRDGFIIIGAIVTACGVGNLLSCGASFGLSKTLGLIGSDDDPGRR